MDYAEESSQNEEKIEEKQNLTTVNKVEVNNNLVTEIDRREAENSTYELDDFNTRLLTENFVYNDCTVPFQEDSENSSIFAKNPISTCLGGGATAAASGGCSGVRLESNGDAQFTKVDLSRAAASEPMVDNGTTYYDDSDELGLASKYNGHKASVRGDMINSINSLRLNVNNHILGGSKNVMNRMRKLSISELNKRTKPTNRKYKIAFYTALCTLSFLFLYLIYQNLFNDR